MKRLFITAFAKSKFALALSVLMFSLGVLPRPMNWFVWNPTPSIPRGLYRVVEEGDVVALTLEDDLRWVRERGYTAPGAYLLKRRVAGQGASFCSSAEGLAIGGRHYQRLDVDTHGRVMPRTALGCSTVSDDHLIVAGDHPRSVDSRYFGPISTHYVAHYLEPVWTY